MTTRRVAVIGAGPAGLMAAERLAQAGLAVSVHDRMPSPGRKFLMAGRGGLNLTHSEVLPKLLARYAGSVAMDGAIETFPPQALRAWADDLGADTFVGTSGRIFPRAMKASPLLRAWLARLRGRDVTLHMRETLVGFDAAQPVLVDASGQHRPLAVDATVLALGGASWPKLGSDGAWVEVLRARHVELAPLMPANCGVRIAWSPATIARLAGQPLKRAAFAFGDRRVRGEAVLTRAGLEGGAIYALASAIREAIAQGHEGHLMIDLLPDLSPDVAMEKLAGGRAADSRANLLRKRLSLSPVALAILRESEGGPLPHDLPALVARAKAVALPVTGVAGLERAISSAGGVRAVALDAALMLRALPGVFVAGEMLDTDAPTGGYLLQAALATGAAAADGVIAWLQEGTTPHQGPSTRSPAIDVVRT